MTTDQILELATEQHRLGQTRPARRLYEQALRVEPANAPAMFRLGVLELQEGRAEHALHWIGKAVAAAPNEPRYLFGLGKALEMLGRWSDSAAAYRLTLRADPQSLDAMFSLGVVLQSGGDLPAAIASYESALKLQPDYVDVLNNLGNCHQLRGDFAEAESTYRRALAIKPECAAAMSNLGVILESQGRVDEAMKLLRDAYAIDPAVAAHAVNFGAALCRLGAFAEAAPVLGEAVKRDPNSAALAFNYGNALRATGHLPEAIAEYRRAATIRPDFGEAWNNLGAALKAMGEFKPAAEAFAAAMAAQPRSIPAINNAGCLLRTLGRTEEAEAVLRNGLAINPNHPTLLNNLASVLKDGGCLDEAIDCFRKAVELDPTYDTAHGCLVYSLSFQSLTPEPILEEARRFDAQHAAKLRPAEAPVTAAKATSASTDRSPDRRLRIGYVSPDFRDHCQSLFTVPLLSHHDHAAYEIFCYSGVERPDAHALRLRGYADHWRDVATLTNAALADLIRQDKIDILVDLTMHMSDGRPLLFARKPAPVQVAWLAYPGTTGLSAMDYRFTDPRLDPPEYDAHYSEKTVRLPDTFWCYDPLATEPAVNELPALSRGHLTLGCLNTPCKVTASTLTLWGGVMRALPTARLLLMAPGGSFRDRLLSRLADVGISGDRVDFASFQPRGDYLRTYHRIDFGLDTFPYNGHTTSLDSVWMGVPVVTRIGQTCVGRAGLSQLHHLDLTDLAADSDEEFTNIAVALANDLPRLSALRNQLRTRLEHSPLMDGARFATNIESAYRRIWRDHVA